MKNRRKTLLSWAAITLVALALTATSGFSQGNAPQLVGSWKAAVTATSPPGLTPFTDLVTFTSDGTVIESRRLLATPTPFGNLLETTGHGAWHRTGAGQFDVHFLFVLQNATTGAEVGTDNVHLSLTLDSTGSILSGTFESTVKDTSGNPIFTASGTFVASPI
ncbi:MAG TPA: hypothetical protein VKB88_00230 [Bryobacteraceae bacterium]|nr:hypothetical protein [Bryobacteraceae bacterium]